MIKGTSHNKFYLSRIASKILVAVCLFLSCNVWALYVEGCGSSYCSGSIYPITTLSECQEKCNLGSGWIKNPGMSYPYELYGPVITNVCGGGSGAYRCSFQYTAKANINGATQAQRDSLTCHYSPSLPACRNPETDCRDQGGVWEDGECKFIDSTACEPFRAKCESQGGKFTGNLTTKGCHAYCNTCTSAYFNQQRNKFINACCGAGYAPPVDLDTTHCTGQGIATGPGMNYSDPITCMGGVACDCKDPDDDVEGFNQYCVGGDRYDEDGYNGEEPPEDDGGEAPRDTVGDGEGDWEYDYYPILDTIRDSLTKAVVPALRDIASCLTAGTCVGGGDTVIVEANGGFDTTLVRDLKTSVDSANEQLKNNHQQLIDTLRNLNQNSEKYVANAVDTLTDSIKKYLADGTAKLKLATDSLTGVIGQVIDGNGTPPDTTSWANYGTSWFVEGEGLADSIKGDVGFSDIDVAGDSSWIDSLVKEGYTCVGDSCCLDGNNFCVHWDSDSSIVDSMRRYTTALHDSLIKVNQQYMKDTVPSIIQEVYDSVKSINPFSIYDSTILQQLGATIPNTNTCPDHCSKFELKIPFAFGLVELPVDYGLCLGRAVFGGGNVLSVVRFLIRLLVAWTCISMVLWNAAKFK